MQNAFQAAAWGAISVLAVWIPYTAGTTQEPMKACLDVQKLGIPGVHDCEDLKKESATLDILNINSIIQHNWVTDNDCSQFAPGCLALNYGLQRRLLETAEPTGNAAEIRQLSLSHEGIDLVLCCRVQEEVLNGAFLHYKEKKFKPKYITTPTTTTTTIEPSSSTVPTTSSPTTVLMTGAQTGDVTSTQAITTSTAETTTVLGTSPSTPICEGQSDETCAALELGPGEAVEFSPECAMGGVGCNAHGMLCCKFCGFADFDECESGEGPVPLCEGQSQETCDEIELGPGQQVVFDPTCEVGGVGCNAADIQCCRFCGFSQYFPCDCTGGDP